MPVKARLALLTRSVHPILGFRWARWPFTVSRADLLDSVQKRMVGIILGIRMLPDEAFEAFYRRRGNETAALVKKFGCWSRMWANALIGWADHLERDRNAHTWAAKLSKVRPLEELPLRRTHFGRPQTGASSGFIRRRWWESLEPARSFSATLGVSASPMLAALCR